MITLVMALMSVEALLDIHTTMATMLDTLNLPEVPQQPNSLSLTLELCRMDKKVFGKIDVL